MSEDDLRTTRAPKAVKACDTCRALKIRCLPGSRPDSCQKCGRLGQTCSFTQRIRKARQTRPQAEGRIAQLESKFDELIARLDRNIDPATSTSTPSSRELNALSSACTTAPDSTFRSHQTLEIEHSGQDWYDFPRVFRGKSLSDLLASLGMPMILAEQAMNRFRTMLSTFPYVVVAPDATFLTLCRDQPLICLSAVSTVVTGNDILQQTLDEVWQEEISRRILFNAERSIELLQAILVHLAWYQFHHSPKRDNSYQLLQMASSMCVDLGLNLTPKEAVSFKVGLTLNHYQRHSLPPSAIHDEFFSRSARRAYLGCFYLATILAWTQGKAHTLQYTDYMVSCARSLQDDPEYHSDRLLLPLLQLQHLADDYHDRFHSARHEYQSTMSYQLTLAHMKSFQKDVAAITANLQPHERSHDLISMTQLLATMRSHEMNVVSPMSFRYQNQPSAAEATLPSQSRSSARPQVLLRCFEAARSYCNHFLTIPFENYNKIMFPQWHCLVYSIVLVYRLSLGLETIPEWDQEVAQANFDLEGFLQSVHEQLGASQRHNGLNNSCNHTQKTLYAVLGPIFANVKATYSRLKLLPGSGSTRDTVRVHDLDFSQTRDIPQSTLKSPSRCPAFPYWGSLDNSNTPSLQSAHAALTLDTLIEDDPLQTDLELWGDILHPTIDENAWQIAGL